MDYFDIYDVNRYDYEGDVAGATITPTFAEMYESPEAFLAEYTNGIFPMTITEANCRTLYFLLYARYGNEEIADTIDINQWRAQLFSIIWQHGPAWEKKLQIQEEIRGWDKDEIHEGAEEIYNTAAHPGKALPEDGIVKGINGQNRSLRKKDKMSAYSYLTAILETDITEEFLIRFKSLFNPYSGIKSRFHIFTTEED